MRIKLLKTIIVCSVLSISLDATSLRDAVEQTINTNPDIIAEHFKKKATKLNIAEQEGDYYPTLDLATFIEKSHTYNDYKDNTNGGKDDAGNKAEVGTYTLDASLVAKDGSRYSSELGTYPIESVKFEKGQAYLKIGSKFVPFEDIKEIRQ